jgi:hypothetical protein
MQTKDNEREVEGQDITSHQEPLCLCGEHTVIDPRGGLSVFNIRKPSQKMRLLLVFLQSIVCLW